jgi:quaternary ammonium compound-resistance protein SugE
LGPLGSAYAIFTGIGAVDTAILGMLMPGESTGALHLLAIALIISGIVMLKLLSPA